MKLNDRTDLSLRVLMVLASRRDRCTANDLADWLGAPANHIVKVVQTLHQHGWVRTKRGRTGGIDLSVDPRTLTAGEVVRRVESGFDLVECFREHGQCPLYNGCALTGALADARDAFLASLDNLTLAELAGSSKTVLLRITA